MGITIAEFRETSCGADLKRDKEANYFARCLLMPRELFIDYVENLKHHNPNKIKDIANKFQVPQEQVIIRLIELGYEVG